MGGSSAPSNILPLGDNIRKTGIFGASFVLIIFNSVVIGKSPAVVDKTVSQIVEADKHLAKLLFLVIATREKALIMV